MNIDGCISEDIHTSGGGEIPSCAGLTPNALPKAQSSKKAESSYTGVSTSYALSQDPPHWYALRCTYGREKTAYEYMTAKGITAFYPTQTTVKLIKGKRKTVTESLLPNIFFAYGTLDQLKHFVYDNVNLPFLRFYYRLLLSSHPCWQPNRKDPNDCPQSSDGKSKNHLCCRNRQHNSVISRSAKVQERTDGESNRRSIQGSDRKSGKMARTTESRSCGG